MGWLHFEKIRLEADAVDKEMLFAKTGSVFPASLHGFLGSTYVGNPVISDFTRILGHRADRGFLQLVP